MGWWGREYGMWGWGVFVTCLTEFPLRAGRAGDCSLLTPALHTVMDAPPADVRVEAGAAQALTNLFFS